MDSTASANSSVNAIGDHTQTLPILRVARLPCASGTENQRTNRRSIRQVETLSERDEHRSRCRSRACLQGCHGDHPRCYSALFRVIVGDACHFTAARRE